MKFDLCITEKELTIYCSKKLEKFANQFIKFYNENIIRIKESFNLKQNIELLVALTDKQDESDIIYEDTGFSGFFNDKGAFAYVNLNGSRSIEYMYKGLMHEITHHIYKHYVYGSNKERITWVDEGIAQFISGQREELNDIDNYKFFLKENYDKSNVINLNKLNHDDRSFGNFNGYNLSYIAIRYLYDSNKKEDFINIIKDYDKLIEMGDLILNQAFSYYKIENINAKKI